MKKRVPVGLGLLLIALAAAYVVNSRRSPVAEREITATADAPAAAEAASAAGSVPANPAPSSPASAPEVPGATPEDHAKMKILEEILAAKNDNDPRLDRELRELSEPAKALLRARYQTFAAEKRNERGTIVFLIGRNLTAAADFDFLNQVLNEPPCLSLEDCSRMAGNPGHSDNHHHDAGNEVTQAYPQIVALKALEAYLFGTNQTPDGTAQALRHLQAALNSPVGKVASMAADIQRSYLAAKQRGRS